MYLKTRKQKILLTKIQLPDAAVCKQAVLDAIRTGYRLIDTAALYMKEMEPDATVISDGFTVSHETAAAAVSDVAADVEEWLHGLGF